MDARRATHLSKFLSLVLRHRPEAAGVRLDAAGWVGVEALLSGCAANGVPLTRDELFEIVESNDKQRFALGGDRIRANQGHSVRIELGLPPSVPPPTLFHGTVARSLDAIRHEGLRPRGRTHVHLSPDRETARKVGQRRGRPVVLEVDAAAMVAAGHTFRRSKNGVWLTENVPPEYLTFPD
ncbi:MAG: RNA 2'-phosphotransferase [Anaeromyxobacteraceae bacterium]